MYSVEQETFVVSTCTRIICVVE